MFTSGSMEVENMSGWDVHSLKPFLLDSILTWSSMQGFTPVLITSPHIERKTPICLISMINSPLAFKLSEKAISERSITTDSISFRTLFPNSQGWEGVTLPVDCWLSLRIVELDYVFDFSFPEHTSAALNHKHGIWPLGVFNPKSTSPVNSLDAKPRVTPATASLWMDKHRPTLSLVWSDGSPVSPRS